jgi:hypothetical protein
VTGARRGRPPLAAFRSPTPLGGIIERVDGTAESVIGLPTILTRRLTRAAMAAQATEGPAPAGRCEPSAGGPSGP